MLKYISIYSIVHLKITLFFGSDMTRYQRQPSTYKRNLMSFSSRLRIKEKLPSEIYVPVN
jgi:hypothetical protein